MPNSELAPDVVICGNVVRDVTPDGWAPGGTAVYAAAVARGLGRRVGVVTAAPADVVTAGLPPDVAVARADVAEATSYENVYTPTGRIQYLRAPGSPIPAATLPDAWASASVALLGPVYHEVTPELAARFRGSVGVCAQGFLRRAGPDGRVGLMPPERWDALPVLRRAAVLFLSEEDLAGGTRQAVPESWLAAVPVTVLTAGWRGARVYAGGRWRPVPAIPVEEVDPTGAGDSFAAAFMVARDEGADPVEATRFAAGAASFTVEARGHQSPTPDAVRARMSSEFRVPSSKRTAPGPGSRNQEPGTPRCP
ncbi:MAG: PfkB family carbohydrate kinase [Dehalococcoidia bacterium]